MCQPAGTTVASTGTTVASAGAVAASTRVVFPLLENYMFSPYIILVSNRLANWYLMKF